MQTNTRLVLPWFSPHLSIAIVTYALEILSLHKTYKNGVDALQGYDINAINKTLNLAVNKRIYQDDNTLTLYARA